MPEDQGPMSWWLLAPVPAVLLGAMVMRHYGIAGNIWGQNIGASLVCIVLGAFFCRKPWSTLQRKLCGLSMTLGAAISLALTFCGPGLDGVHRWLMLGGVRIHPASIALPLFIIARSSIQRGVNRWVGWLLSFTISAILLLQPDAGEATGFAFAAADLFRSRSLERPGKWDWFGALTLFGLASATWFRADPLKAVPHVEGIVGLAVRFAPVIAVAAILSLMLMLLPFAVIWKRFPNSETSAAALALGLYFLGILLATFSGRFPVPLLGYGVSPILGYYAALTLLLQSRKETSSRLAGFCMFQTEWKKAL
jgi:cell division protein FtsW (lipid II flippase)